MVKWWREWCGDVVMWRSGDVAKWWCGDVAMWRCGDVAKEWNGDVVMWWKSEMVKRIAHPCPSQEGNLRAKSLKSTCG